MKRERHGLQVFPYGVKMRNQRVRKLEERSSVRVLTNSKCLSDEIYIRDCDQKDQKKRDIGYDCYSAEGLLYHSVKRREDAKK